MINITVCFYAQKAKNCWFFLLKVGKAWRFFKYHYNWLRILRMCRHVSEIQVKISVQRVICTIFWYCFGHSDQANMHCNEHSFMRTSTFVKAFWRFVCEVNLLETFFGKHSQAKNIISKIIAINACSLSVLCPRKVDLPNAMMPPANDTKERPPGTPGGRLRLCSRVHWPVPSLESGSCKTSQEISPPQPPATMRWSLL